MRMEEASSRSLDADAIVIPPGKQLRFRCKFKGCLKNRSFSMVSVMDHVAAHFARQKGSDRVFNYYCRKCGVRFFLKGMCLGCKCNARGGGEQFIPLKSGITLEDMKREASFFTFVHKWVVPVLDNITSAPPANSVRPQTSASTDEVEVKEHGPVPIPQERIPSPKRGRPPTPYPYPRSSSPGTPARTPHLLKSAKSPLTRTPAAFAQEEDSDVVTSEADKPEGTLKIRGLLSCVMCDPKIIVEMNFTALFTPKCASSLLATGKVRMASRTPLHYPQGTQFYDDEEKLQSPGHCPALPSNRNERSASNFLKDGNSVTRMSEDGGNRALEKWDSSMRKPHSCNNDLSRSEILTTSASSTQPSAHPSTSNSGAQPQRPLQDTAEKAEEKQHSAQCLKAEVSSPDLALNITTYSSMAIATPGDHASSSPPSAQTSPSSLDVHGGTISDCARVLLPPPPPPPPLDAKESASQSESEHSLTTAQCDKNAKKRPVTTVRVLNKKSRQDRLLEENPSLPRLSRRLSRSPGIHGSKTPTYRQVGLRTLDHNPHISSDSCTPSPRLKNETTDYPTPSNAHHTPAYAPLVSVENIASNPAAEIPLPASTLGSSPSTSVDTKEDVYNNTRNVQERSGIANVPNGEGETDQTSNNRPYALPPPIPPPFFPPPFPPPPYPYMMSGQLPMPPLPFPMYNQFGPPPQFGVPYLGPLASGTPPPEVPPPRPTPPTLMPPMGYHYPYHPMYYYPPQQKPSSTIRVQFLH